MDGASFIARFREETMDEAEGQLWSDELILRYFDEAQTAFCRQTDGIPDKILVTVSAGSNRLRFNPRIKKVRAATIPGSHSLELMSVEQARPSRESSGVPRTIVMGTNKGTAEVHPTPTVDTQVLLDVLRLPLNDITHPSDESEVDDIYATDLMMFALYRAYSRPDPDTMDRVRADYFRGQFDDACVRARREQGKARKPNGVTNFSW